MTYTSNGPMEVPSTQTLSSATCDPPCFHPRSRWRWLFVTALAWLDELTNHRLKPLCYKVCELQSSPYCWDD